MSLTTTQLFNLSPAERTAAINTIAGEAYQGAGGADIAAVTANLLSRRLANYGGNTNLIDIVKAPQQYEANFNLTRDQIINPNLISKADRERIGAIFDNPALIKDAYQKTGGALSFRGTANYKYRRGDEYTPVEGKSNFYFDPLNPETYQKGLNVFSGIEAVGPATERAVQPGTTTDATKSNLGNSITNNFLTNYIFGTADIAKKEDKPKSLVDQLKENLFGQAMGMASQRGSTASLAQQVINRGRSEEEYRKKRSLTQQLVDQIKLGGGFISPGGLMQNYNDFYNRLF